MDTRTFEELIAVVTDQLSGQPLDDQLCEQLNQQFPADGEHFSAIQRACHQAISEGSMCQHEAGGIRYGRVIKADDNAQGFSVDVVRMNNIKGPHHSHPLGEINMIMPINTEALFDGKQAGWWVYPAGSAHHPTVSNGEALVLYLLPQGSIEFSRTQ